MIQICCLGSLSKEHICHVYVSVGASPPVQEPNPLSGGAAPERRSPSWRGVAWVEADKVAKGSTVPPVDVLSSSYLRLARSFRGTWLDYSLQPALRAKP